MSYLDQLPLDYTRPEVQQLRDLFVMAYKRPVTAEEVAEAAGIVPGTFPWHDNLRTTFTELLKVMALQGKLRAMVEAAAADPTIMAYQDRFKDMLTESPAVSTITSINGQGGWRGPDSDKRVARQLHLQRLMEKRSRLTDINIARQVTQVAQSVVKLTLHYQNEKGHGTGFLITPDQILTNHHNVAHNMFGDVTAVSVEFDYQSVVEPPALVRQGDVATIIKNEAHDWAVIRLDHAVERPPIALGTPFVIAKNDPVVIIQHPGGAFKQFSIDWLSIQYVDDEIVQYLADTQDGSSGSPVFNIAMQVIALHHAEEESTVEIDGRQESVWRNQGIRIDQVIADLQTHGIEFNRN